MPTSIGKSPHVRAAGLGPAVSRRAQPGGSRCSRVRLLLIALIAPGCFGARGDIEVVEARLRQQQDLVSRYERDLMLVERQRDEARHDAELLRKQVAESGQQALPADFTRSLFEIRGIEFNSLMTGGRDRDGQPGDDVLVAVFVPRDEHGDIVKLPGAIELEALDLNRPDAERLVGKWTFTTEESRKLWKSGAFSSGFQVVVPLPETTSNEKLVLHARLATADGREFDATHTVKLKPADGLAGGRPQTGPGFRTAPLVPPAEAIGDPPGRAVITPAAHAETKPMQPERKPRPTLEPLAREPDSPLVPIPSEDAFTPPADDTGDPFADAPVDTDETADTPADLPTDGDPPADDAQPRPFPAGPQTSDNFTDETLPFVR